MHEIQAEFTFAAAHQLPRYQGKCRNLHGHNYKMAVTLRGELDAYGKDPVEVLKSSLVPAPKKGELVIVSQLDFHSMCPHHLLPYKGIAAVGYVADRHLVGLGKIAESVDALSHRLILQENLVQRLCASVMEALQPLGAGVVIAAEHGCMQVRGPRRRQSRVTVEAWAGSFEKDPELRASLARRAEG